MRPDGVADESTGFPLMGRRRGRRASLTSSDCHSASQRTRALRVLVENGRLHCSGSRCKTRSGGTARPGSGHPQHGLCTACLTDLDQSSARFASISISPDGRRIFGRAGSRASSPVRTFWSGSRMTAPCRGSSRAQPYTRLQGHALPLAQPPDRVHARTMSACETSDEGSQTSARTPAVFVHHT